MLISDHDDEPDHPDNRIRYEPPKKPGAQYDALAVDLEKSRTSSPALKESLITGLKSLAAALDAGAHFDSYCAGMKARGMDVPKMIQTAEAAANNRRVPSDIGVAV